MALRFYDTATRSVRDFVPIEDGKAGIYLCGATVQAPPHVGHIRSGVAFDVIRRWLTARGYDVTFVRNVTDIDDKIIAQRRARRHVPYWDVAMRNERAFARAYDVLGCLPPTYEPRATGHVPEMVTLMQRLIDDGHGYAAGRGRVLRRPRLPGLRIAERAAHRRDAAGRRLRRHGQARPPRLRHVEGRQAGGARVGHPVGPGATGLAPGVLGDGAPSTSAPSFDIHGGGLDLIFPHHENEIAQSKAAGDGFANYWLHNAWVTTAGEKMSKSLGNSLLVDEVVQRVRPVELRYYLAGSHYRSMHGVLRRVGRRGGPGVPAHRGLPHACRARRSASPGAPDVRPEARPAAFDAAMDDDIAVPQALAVVHEHVRAGNAALAADDTDAVAAAFAAVVAMVDVLGPEPVGRALGRRQAAPAASGRPRSSTRWCRWCSPSARRPGHARTIAAADAIRDGLDRIGIQVEDTAHGVRWSLDD